MTMINRQKNLQEWLTWLFELTDASEHLQELIDDANEDDFSEEDLRVQLGHVYAHLNRAWNLRDVVGEDAENREALSHFPQDLECR